MSGVGIELTTLEFITLTARPWPLPFMTDVKITLDIISQSYLSSVSNNFDKLDITKMPISMLLNQNLTNKVCTLMITAAGKERKHS